MTPKVEIDEDLAKRRITANVNAYKQVFNKEYHQVMEICQEKRNKQLSSTGNIQKVIKGVDALERPAYDISETLFTIFQRALSPDELVWFRTTPATLWFMRTFPEFRTVEKI